MSEAGKTDYLLSGQWHTRTYSQCVAGRRLWWNQAFEAAGYKNAFQVKLLPDSADPMDIRYNLINWVHRSTRGWSYGAAVVDPRTGEIIKGQVSLARCAYDRII